MTAIALILLVASAVSAPLLARSRRRAHRLEDGTFGGLAQELAALDAAPVRPLRPQPGARASRDDFGFALAA